MSQLRTDLESLKKLIEEKSDFIFTQKEPTPFNGYVPLSVHKIKKIMSQISQNSENNFVLFFNNGITLGELEVLSILKEKT